MAKRVLIHDLPPQQAQTLLGSLAHTFVYCADAKAATCKGCFGCWLKTPGACIFRDGMQQLEQELAGCEELVVVCRNVYGGFSPQVKQAIDRCIHLCLPFFRVIKNELHHVPRYPSPITLKTYFYNEPDMTLAEKDVAQNITAAVSLNFNAREASTIFLPCPEALKEAFT